ncbi:MAG: CARDB domain-containing protein [Candidatus Peregrinibacteria bacterium]|nr:CARDB domain-containing protein [Candidatus Peregrinibacteria bacterium]MDZ4245351.1 CARDB domain-containing protein [Candidatus Gracilibacteria bacterium]
MKITKKAVAVLAGIIVLASTTVAQILPDLTVKNVSMDDQSRVTFQLANESSDAIDANSDGFVYVYVDGKVAWTYNWKYLKETGFLNADGSSIITSQIPKGNGNVKVCIDARDNVSETDEANNCLEVQMNMVEGNEGSITTGELPDLAVTNIELNPFNGNLIVEHGNIGKGRVSDFNGNVNIYVDGNLRWTYNYSSMNKQFLNPGATDTIIPNKLRNGEHTVTACTSTRDVIAEVSKENNCLTRTVSDVNPSRYVRTGKVQNDGVVKYRRRNMEMPTMNQPQNKPDFVIEEVYKGDDNVIYARVVNKGSDYNNQSTAGAITFYLEGKAKKPSMWTNFSDLSFLSKGGESVLPIYETIGAHQVKVCIDESNKVQEKNENNNCLTALVK